jgi:hypothetical protein
MLGVIQFSGFIQIVCVWMHVLMIFEHRRRNWNFEIRELVFDKWEEDERKKKKEGQFHHFSGSNNH